jgi:UDP-glucuronate 4-epimerase
LLEAATGKSAVKEFEPMQPGDVPATYADVDDLVATVDFRPRTAIEDGVASFVGWYRGYHRI